MRMHEAAVAAFRKSTPFVERLSHLPAFRVAPGVRSLESAVHSLWSRGGKRLRPHLVYWFGELADVAPERLDLYAWAAEVVHTATLLHDDVIDGAEVRRDGATANRRFGNTVAILAGDALLSDVMFQLATHGHPELLTSLCRVLKDACRGEGLQHELIWRIPPSLGPYLRVMELKTASLFRWCGSVGLTLARHPARDAARAFLGKLGLLFQISDDLLDVVGTDSKERWMDLREGRLNAVTWRLVHADAGLRAHVEASFARRRPDLGLAWAFEDHPRLPAAVADTRRAMRWLAGEAERDLASFPAGAIQDALLDLTWGMSERRE